MKIKAGVNDRVELSVVVDGRRYSKLHFLKSRHTMEEAEFLVARMMREAYRDAEADLGGDEEWFFE